MAITIYGASDDLIEVDGDVEEEFYLPGDNEADVILTAPDGATLVVNLGFCTDNPDGWHIKVASHGRQTPSWPLRFVPCDTSSEDDPALVIDTPAGTTVGRPSDPQED